MTTVEKEFLIILKNSIHPAGSYDIDIDDWKAVFSVASHQNLLPLIYDAASDYPCFSEFDEAHPEYMASTMRLIGTQIQNTSEFLNLYRAFLKNGLAPVVVKGIVCQLLYGELQDFRLSGDEDILIEKRIMQRPVLC